MEKKKKKSKKSLQTKTASRQSIEEEKVECRGYEAAEKQKE